VDRNVMTVITKKTSAKEISKILKKKASGKVMETKRFSGKLSWKGDALKTQKEMRDDDSLLVDTNIVIYSLQGVSHVNKLLEQRKIYVSFITEIELYSWPDLKCRMLLLLQPQSKMNYPLFQLM